MLTFFVLYVIGTMVIINCRTLHTIHRVESVAVDDLENETGWMRIADIMAKKLGGRYYFQRNASIFFDVVDGEVKLMNFHCLFG